MGNIQIYLIALVAFSLPAILISIPAYYILKKRNRIFFADYFLPAYATTLLTIMFSYCATMHVDEGVSNLLEDHILVSVISIAINYIKIYVPKWVPTKILSITSILIMFIFTILLFLVIPSTGE